MMKSFVAGITALSLALTSAAPVSADGLDREDVGKLLLGLVAIAAVGAAVENNRREEEQAEQTQTRGSGSWADLNHPRWRQDNRHDLRRLTLPYGCLQTVDTRFGDLRLFGDHCLQRNFRYAADLPQRCAVRVYSDRGPRDGYDPLCLHEQGYRTNRRH